MTCASAFVKNGGSGVIANLPHATNTIRRYLGADAPEHIRLLPRSLWP